MTFEHFQMKNKPFIKIKTPKLTIILSNLSQFDLTELNIVDILNSYKHSYPPPPHTHMYQPHTFTGENIINLHNVLK